MRLESKNLFIFSIGILVKGTNVATIQRRLTMSYEILK